MVDLKIEIPDSFFEAETRSGYAIDTKTKEIWAVELDLYCELMRVCKKHGIRVFADGGTMIGAIRHKGFIPWDDDIDLSVSRRDYIKLCEVAPKEFSYPYFFQTEETDPGSTRGHAQLRNSDTCAMLKKEERLGYRFNQGIFIDIFPIDVVPVDAEKRREMVLKIEDLRRKSGIYRRKYYGNYISEGYRKYIVKLRKMLIKAFSVKYDNRDYKKMEKEKRKYEGIDSPYVANLYKLINNNPEKLVWKKDWFKDSVEVPFEFITMSVPAGYEEYLDSTYGDWRKFVMGDTTHGDIIFDTDRSYSEYFK